MTAEEIITKFLNVKSWKKGDIRAPHKPLLLLYALAKLSNGVSRLSYADLEKDLQVLLSDFGPHCNTYQPRYPFWRLQTDQIWSVSLVSKLQPNSSGDVSRKDLIAAGAIGEFEQSVIKTFQLNPTLISTVIVELLDANFPSTIHEDIVQSLGIHLTDIADKSYPKKRCSRFREKILRAYEYRCAVCGFNVRLGHTPIALEAAHIKWHQAGGPDVENNGLALCVLHHKLFDRGAFTLSDKLEILVSDKANGTQGFHQWLIQYHGAKIHYPQSTTYSPQNSYLEWHTNEVFQGMTRDFLLGAVSND